MISGYVETKDPKKEFKVAVELLGAYEEDFSSLRSCLSLQETVLQIMCSLASLMMQLLTLRVLRMKYCQCMRRSWVRQWISPRRLDPMT